MKYKVTHSVLSATLPADKDNPHGTSKTFKLDEKVEDKDLTAAGFDVKFLLKNGAIGKLEGQDYGDDDASASDDTVNAKPAGDVAKSSDGDGKSADTARATPATVTRPATPVHAPHAKR